MISPGQARYCCEDISLIENYEEAMADTTQTWICHHRLEYVDGKVTSQAELKAKGLLYNRPASELIFLTPKAHGKIPKHTEESKKKTSAALKGRPKSEEHRRKISEANKGEKNSMYGKTGDKNPMYGMTGEKHPMYGKHHSEETRKKMSENNAHYWKGKKRTAEARKKMSESNTQKQRALEYKEYKSKGGALTWHEWRKEFRTGGLV